MAQTEALKQLREVHAIQGRDGCWDIDDYMLGLYNGLELALSIVENRACKYKQRPKSQPEQEPVAWEQFHEHMAGPNYVAPQRTWVGLTDEEIDQGLLRSNHALQTAGAWRDGVEWATKQLKEKNT